MIKPIPIPSCEMPELINSHKNLCAMNNCLHFYKPIDRKQVLGAREVLFKTMHHILNSELTNEIKDEIIAMYNIVINNIDKVTEKQYWKNKQQFKGGAK